jgi:hypothetical protein
MVWTHAGEVINLLRKQLGLEGEFLIVEKVWNKEIGIEGVEIVGYKSGTIFVKTSSSVAGYEIFVRKKEIIKKLNQYVCDSKIKKIKINIE